MVGQSMHLMPDVVEKEYELKRMSWLISLDHLFAGQAVLNAHPTLDVKTFCGHDPDIQLILSPNTSVRAISCIYF